MARPALHIDHCYCFRQPFAALKRIADATGAATVEALQEHVVFGAQCRLCHPYVRRMLRTGETAFHEIIAEADEPAARADEA